MISSSSSLLLALLFCSFESFLTFFPKVKVFLDNSGVLSTKLSNLILTLLCGRCFSFSFSFLSDFFSKFFFSSLFLFLLVSTPEYICNKLAASLNPFFRFLSKFFFLSFGEMNLDCKEGDAILCGSNFGVLLTLTLGFSAFKEYT